MAQTRTAPSTRGVPANRLPPARRQASASRRSPVRTTSPYAPRRNNPNTWGQVAKDIGMAFVEGLFGKK